MNLQIINIQHLPLQHLKVKINSCYTLAHRLFINLYLFLNRLPVFINRYFFELLPAVKAVYMKTFQCFFCGGMIHPDKPGKEADRAALNFPLKIIRIKRLLLHYISPGFYPVGFVKSS